MTAVATVDLEALLEAMVTAESSTDRLAAAGVLFRAGYSGVRVACRRCARDERTPLVLTVSQMLTHLIKRDSTVIVQARGFRIHQPGDVVVWDEDQPGAGPAMRGPA